MIICIFENFFKLSDVYFVLGILFLKERMRFLFKFWVYYLLVNCLFISKYIIICIFIRIDILDKINVYFLEDK